MPKLLPFVLMHLAFLSSAQLLTIENLRHLSQSDEQILDTKLSAHFDLVHHPEASEANVKVYSNQHLENPAFTVLTVILKNSGCHVFSIVSHDREQVTTFNSTLHRDKFKAETIKDSNGEEINVYEKDQVKVLIKNPDHAFTAHQIIWMCN